MDLRIRLVDGVISPLLLNVRRSAFSVRRSGFGTTAELAL
jgi:hypothetical protein